MSLNSVLDSEVRRFLNKSVKMSPEFAAFNKFRYKSPKGYCEYNKVILNLAIKLFVLGREEMRDLFLDSNAEKKIYGDVFANSLKMVAYSGLRPYWLARPLATAFVKTVPPINWKLNTKELGGVIFLPSNTFLLADGEHIEWIFFYFYQNLLVLYASPQQNSDVIIVSSFEDLYKTTTSTDNILGNPSSSLIEPWTNQSSSEKLGNIFAQTFLYIENYEPHFNLNYFPTEKKSNKRQKQDALGLIIGSNYHIKHNSFSDGNAAGTGTSKATHWRSGHWRNQPYGDKTNPKTKMIWLEPVLINAP